MHREKICNIASISALLACAVVPAARAEVTDAGANGFTVSHDVTIAADRMAVYEAAVRRIADWWSSDHTVSGDAANLYIDTGLPGCFCETLGDGAGLVHLSVTFVNPGILLRMSGGLGPLGLMGVAGNMTWEFVDAGDSTVVKLEYAVGGYRVGGLDGVAAPVDRVLVEQMARLKSFVETGSAEQG
jgi:hypothetical protein